MRHQQIVNPEALSAVTRELAKHTPLLVASSTVAIVGARAPSVRQIGSGTLLAIADAKFVVTAAHVLVHAKEFGMTIGVSGGADNSLTTLAGNWIVTSAETGDNKLDERDIAIYRLDERQISRLSEVNFVRIGDISFESDLSKGYFIVSGFPGIWSTISDSNEAMMKSRMLHYGTYAFTGAVAGLNGYNAERHLLLEATPGPLCDHEGNLTNFRTRLGHWADMPRDLAGVSGCSVWRIGDLAVDINQWSSRSARIVGVETGVFERAGAIKVTRWNAVLSILHAAYPDTRRAIELYV